VDAEYSLGPIDDPDRGQLSIQPIPRRPQLRLGLEALLTDHFLRTIFLEGKLFHKAARCGEWAIVRSILDFEYEWQQADWFNIREITGEH
jgi:hypothetical protein